VVGPFGVSLRPDIVHVERLGQNYGLSVRGFTIGAMKMSANQVGAVDFLCVIPSLSADSDRLERCLTGVRRSLPGNSRTVVVWNSPEPFPAEEEGIVVYRPGLNLGYGPAINVVAERYPSEFIWAVQDDMTFPEPYLSVFATAMRTDDSLAVLTPALVGTSSAGRFEPRGGEISADGSLRKRQAGVETRFLGDVEFVPGGWVPLSGAVIRTSSFLEIGGFDPAFFPVSHSDVDLCWRMNNAGFSVGAVVNYAAIHKKAASTPSSLGTYLHTENGAYFKNKVGGGDSPTQVVDVPPELLASVAAAASLKLLGYAKFVDEGYKQDRGSVLSRLRRSLGRRWDVVTQRFGRKKV
jgi:GT2 family glycosyltransferase